MIPCVVFTQAARSWNCPLPIFSSNAFCCFSILLVSVGLVELVCGKNTGARLDLGHKRATEGHSTEYAHFGKPAHVTVLMPFLLALCCLLFTSYSLLVWSTHRCRPLGLILAPEKHSFCRMTIVIAYTPSISLESWPQIGFVYESPKVSNHSAPFQTTRVSLKGRIACVKSNLWAKAFLGTKQVVKHVHIQIPLWIHD